MSTYNYHGYNVGESVDLPTNVPPSVTSGEPCPTCLGYGDDQDTPRVMTCPDCGGCGYVMTDDPRKDDDCLTCKGETYVKEVLRDDADVYEDVVQLCPSCCGGTGRKG